MNHSVTYSFESDPYLNLLFRIIRLALKFVEKNIKSAKAKKIIMKIFWHTYLMVGLLIFSLFKQRVFEYSWVKRNIGTGTMRILDFGCSGSLLSLYLASYGHQVVGIDLRDYFIGHFLDFNFTKGDARKMPFTSSCFDRIVAVSSIEHIGSDWDRSFILEMYRILKDNGLIILTFPYSKEKGIIGGSKIYDDEMISFLIGNEFEIKKVRYIFKKGGKWEWASRKQVLYSNKVERRKNIDANVLLVLSKRVLKR